MSHEDLDRGDDGQFGEFGGRHVPEMMEEPLAQLAEAFETIVQTPEFHAEFRDILEPYAGRPTPLYHAANLSEEYGADIYLKREDLLHGGAHKINNAVGQALLASKAGKSRLIAETGAGQHGTATAMVGALFGMDTEIYMGKKDVERQKMNVWRDYYNRYCNRGAQYDPHKRNIKWNKSYGMSESCSCSQRMN